MRFAAPLSAVALTLLGGLVSRAVDPALPQGKANATLPEYHFGDASRWLPQLKSFYLQGEVRFESTPAAIAKKLREIKSQYPDLKDPDPMQFPELQPVVEAAMECAFDQTRIRQASVQYQAQRQERWRDVRIWNGKHAIMLWQAFPSKDKSIRLAPKPDRVVELLGCGYVSYLGNQPPVFWWNRTSEAKKEYELYAGTPSDYVLVGRETYHGVDCHVYLSAVGNQSDRHYVGVKDGRWYGAREGILMFSKDGEAAFTRNYQKEVEEFLGKKLGENVSDAVWEEVSNSLRSLPQDKKIAWCQKHYSGVVKDYIPVFEYWFSDFRDLGNGRVYPYREVFLFNGSENRKPFLETTRTLTIKEIKIDQPLADSFFEEPLTEGAKIADELHQPTLHYKYKAKFTTEEWQKIVNEAKEQDKEQIAQRQKVESLLGKPAPALPGGEWFHSKPLTWADLRGKIVVLKFWAIGCAPCYGEFSALRASNNKDQGNNDQGAKDRDKKTSRIPIAFIGVHAAGNTREEIAKVIDAQKLIAPIFIDRSGVALGEFFDQCQVKAMPTTVAVDEEGRILAHGQFGEVMAAVSKRINKLAAKSD